MFLNWRKTRARATAAKARRIAYEMDPEAGHRLAANFPDEAWPAIHATVAGYRAIHDEIDPEPLMETFFCEQARLCLPCVAGPDQPLVFRAWSPGDPLVRGAFGVEEPAPEAPEARPRLVLLPLLGFDEAGRRIGYGAGFYDRTLEALRRQGPVTAVGIAYEAQKLDRVPAARHDAPVDWIVTEQRAYRTGT
ncbi:5-formyltetrahydrofolate cyclo-ligase [Marinicauda salina]|jgi:5-formyltetrahydrofolate cyclo-ligase|uniref:5-formyltetrahydrofolate cyclo-ligase n=1 Tax=Marinicauda salina TaxID=2135793 RepID=A0A2U2BXH6_9PROT|nr:5-formyltetrahydrofolate cyclo-ligase [Marinicauda salina]PWE18712.1 5-formyltetrahydrofolate cyclo-ligase [Marinicauda salina]